MEKANFRREIIKDYALLEYLDLPELKYSEKNKQIVKRYAAGETYSELAKCYNVTANAIQQRIEHFIRRVGKITGEKYIEKYRNNQSM